MFVVTFRKGGLKKAGIACACGVLLVAAAIGINALRFGNDNGPKSTETAAKLTQEMASAEDLVTFLRGYSVEADVTTATVSTVTVPRKWDESFQAFHEVLTQSGLTLKKCKGKQVDKWALLIPAKSTEESKSYAIVLVYENKPVGAYLLTKPSGEVQPLAQAKQTAAPLTDEELQANAAFGEDMETVTVTDGQAQETAAIDDEDAVIDGGAQDVATVPDEADMPTE